MEQVTGGKKMSSAKDNLRKILVVEDDADINQLLMKILSKQGFQVRQAYSGTEAQLLLSMETFDMVLLDLMLPGITGEELIEIIREKEDLPILVLSAKTALEDKVKVLNLGADDYLSKPFEKDEVIARVHAALRRYHKTPLQQREETKFKYKKLILDSESREAMIVKIDGSEQNLLLTSHEFDILLLLVQNPNKVFSRESLYEKVWDGGYYGEDHTVNVHVSNLRKKMNQIDPEEEYIKTVWGIGFKMV